MGRRPHRSRRATDGKEDDRAGDKPPRGCNPNRNRFSKGLVVGLVVGGVFLLLLVVVGIGVAVYFAASRVVQEAPDTEWQEIAPAKGGFTVLMPGAPADKSQDKNGVFLNKYEVQRPDNGKRFSVSFLDLPPKAVRPNSLEVLTNAERDNLANKMNGKVTSETPIALGDVAGREFRITAADGSVLVSRVYLAKVGGRHRVFQLVVAGFSVTPGQGDSARFFDSFRLDGPAKPPESAPAPGPKPQSERTPSGPPSPRPVWREDESTRTIAEVFSPDGAYPGRGPLRRAAATVGRDRVRRPEGHPGGHWRDRPRLQQGRVATGRRRQ